MTQNSHFLAFFSAFLGFFSDHFFLQKWAFDRSFLGFFGSKQKNITKCPLFLASDHFSAHFFVQKWSRKYRYNLIKKGGGWELKDKKKKENVYRDGESIPSLYLIVLNYYAYLAVNPAQGCNVLIIVLAILA